MRSRLPLSIISSILLLVMGQLTTTLACAGENSDAMKSMRKQTIATGKTGRTIAYGTANKGEIWVFTDLGCPACNRLHQDVKELNSLGVKVNFMAFPRQGIGSNGYTKMVNIWCAKDPANTLNNAVRGESIPTMNCENPVQMQYNLGQTWQISGTPTIIFKDGTQWAGYFNPERLAKEAIARSAN
jgi:thiol:disulfide interchange protein DsbC